jgi:hypothetical protein
VELIWRLTTSQLFEYHKKILAMSQLLLAPFSQHVDWHKEWLMILSQYCEGNQNGMGREIAVEKQNKNEEEEDVVEGVEDRPVYSPQAFQS